MMSISQNQLLRLWGELMDAYHGKNGFGSDTAEIYAYTLREDCPSRFLLPEASISKESIAGGNRSAADALAGLCLKFEKDHDCKIRIDRMSIKRWRRFAGSDFTHRAHVKVTPNLKKETKCATQN